MSLIVPVSITGILVIIIVLYWYRSRNLDKRLRRLSTKLSHILRRKKNCSKTQTKELLKQLFALLQAYMDRQNSAGAYKTVDLLKLAYGEGLMRDTELTRLTALILQALDRKQFDIAGMVMDAYSPLLRTVPLDYVPQVTGHLTLIAAISLKERRNFLASKALDHIYFIWSHGEWCENAGVVHSALRAFRIIGYLILRRRDEPFFRDISNQFVQWSGKGCARSMPSDLLHILVGWMHRIVKIDDMRLFNVMEDMIARLVEQGLFGEAAMSAWLREWQNLAGVACMNPDSSMGSLLTTQILRFGAPAEAGIPWDLAVSNVGQTARLAISLHGLKDAFPVFYVLLNRGRILFTDQLKFSSLEHMGRSRQNDLYLITRECLTVIEFVSRSSMTSSAGDVIVELFHYWLAYPPAASHAKSIKKFCRFLLVYWSKVRPRQAKKGMPVYDELCRPSLLSEQEQEKLGI
ncbi:Hypothetical protein LUCI_4015 [Lucifera butyrica]|uniref:Uncharacterized protein n=1 Tax=Lucifera butyrica TaxID=1351585 RepID=A0A498RCU9_9FIRM|nr:hypothetical protein [Lucifera butyrica]VBB08737.1 Hypothetical protein LUCI_4015 [Lucifera butyrica]